LGIAAWWFALLHSYFGFHRFVGGFEGLRYWSTYFAWSLAAGLLALVLMSLLVIASAPWVVRRMRRSWKPLQRAVYLAAVLTLVHAVTVTVHVRRLRTFLVIGWVLLVVLVALELRRLERH